MGNVVLVTVDSLRADHVTWHGYDRPTTEALDSIAQESHVFENAFAQAGSTRPSFPSILSSVYALMYGGPDHVTPEQSLVAEVLADHGYRTAGFHSNPYLSAEFGYDRGFQTFFDTNAEASALSRLRQYLKRTVPSDSAIYQGLQALFNTTESVTGVDIGAAYLDAETITDRAIEWVDSTDPDDDHFLWVHYMDVHHPYVPPARHQRPFRDRVVDEREAVRLRRRMLTAPAELTQSERQTLVDLYDAEIRYVDTEIERLAHTISTHWSEPTVTIVTADHGEEFMDHGAYSHGTLHDEGIHVPLLLDDDSRGRRHDDLVGLIDIPPTIVELTGATIPDNWYGESLRPVLDGASLDRDAVFGNWGDPDGDDQEFYYRSHEWKYISDNESGELYHLPNDPDEQVDVADEYPEIVTEIQDRIDAHRHEITETHRDIAQTDIDSYTKERLAHLGYREE